MRFVNSVIALRLALLLALVIVNDAVDSNKNMNNFRVVLDSPPGNDKKTRLMLKNRILQNNELDLQALVARARKEFHDISIKTQELTSKVRVEAHDLMGKLKDNLQHYSKREIGFYAALTLALTLTLKTVVFSKATTKTVDLSRINCILASPAAMLIHESVIELQVGSNTKRKNKKPVRIFVTPSIVSSDGKTYVRTVKQTLRSGSTVNKPMPLITPARPAQVVVDTVTAFYREAQKKQEQVSPASHNAVIQTMSPAMRRSLKARRIRGGAGTNSLLHRLEVGGYFGLWYILNVVYNIVNKKVLNVLPAPLMLGTIQFGIGALYCALVWLLRIRPFPKLTPAGKSAVTKVGIHHALGQLTSMISLGAGPVSFTHIVKAMEPFFSAIVSGFYFQKWMPYQVYATLIPVVCGVGYACMKELNFSWLAFGTAMASNLFFALRAVTSKIALQSSKATGTNLTPPNMFGLVTWAAFLLSIPVALILEGQGFGGLWSEALAQVESKSHFLRAVALSGLFHYLNNEVMYLALGSVHPVTLAVGNTMKRVFILVASVMVFRNPISVQAGIGSAVGIAGVLLYSLTKQYYETLESSNRPSKLKAKVSVKQLGAVKKPGMKTKTPAIRAR